jgi:hypothetical protein
MYDIQEEGDGGCFMTIDEDNVNGWKLQKVKNIELMRE